MLCQFCKQINKNDSTVQRLFSIETKGKVTKDQNKINFLINWNSYHNKLDWFVKLVIFGIKFVCFFKFKKNLKVQILINLKKFGNVPKGEVEDAFLILKFVFIVLCEHTRASRKVWILTFFALLAMPLGFCKISRALLIKMTTPARNFSTMKRYFVATQRRFSFVAITFKMNLC